MKKPTARTDSYFNPHPPERVLGPFGLLGKMGKPKVLSYKDKDFLKSERVRRGAVTDNHKVTLIRDRKGRGRGRPRAETKIENRREGDATREEALGVPAMGWTGLEAECDYNDELEARAIRALEGDD